MAHILVTGSDGDPPYPQRLNIVDLKKDEKQWSLYILALIDLQGGRPSAKASKWLCENPPLNQLSWMPICSIHGWPLEYPWQDGGSKLDPGYCTHSDPRFPTWHRAYLALFEQALRGAALEIAKNYTTEQDDWGKAATNLRCPYWDWADPATYLPPPEVYDYITFKTLPIITPNGTKNLPNPLVDYFFERKVLWDSTIELNGEYRTVRYPHVQEKISAFMDTLKTTAEKGVLQYDVWLTLNLATIWDELYNSKTDEDNQDDIPRANTLETLHNWIHDRTGGGGHMSWLPAAAYDPIFMLHHCNVDRLLALWQALNPDAWIDDESGQKSLNPFWQSQDAFFNSTDDKIKKYDGFGAIYPEFYGLEDKTVEEKTEAIQAKVDALYKPKDEDTGVSVGASPNSRRIHFVVPIRVRKFQYNGTFNVFVFLGAIPAKPEEWVSSPDFAGSHTEFASSPESCKNCKEHSNAVTDALISLDTALKAKGLEGKEEDEIKEFIKKNIKLGIVKANGTVIVLDGESPEIDVGEHWKSERVKHLEGIKLGLGRVVLGAPGAKAPLIYDDIQWGKRGYSTHNTHA